MEALDDKFDRLNGRFDVDLMMRRFANDAVRILRMELPAGHFAMKHKHSYDHYSILAEGRAIVKTDDGEVEYRAGDVILIKAGVRHEIIAVDDIMWFCIHSHSDFDEIEIGG